MTLYNPFSQHSKANYLLTKQVQLHKALTAQLTPNPSNELQALRNEQIQLQINSLLEANYQLRKAFQIQDHKLPQSKGVVFFDNFDAYNYLIAYKTPTIAHTFAPFIIKAISAYNHNITQSKLADLSILLDTPISDPDALALHSVLSARTSNPFYITTTLPVPTLEALARFHKTDIFHN